MREFVPRFAPFDICIAVMVSVVQTSACHRTSEDFHLLSQRNAAGENLQQHDAGENRREQTQQRANQKILREALGFPQLRKLYRNIQTLLFVRFRTN